MHFSSVCDARAAFQFTGVSREWTSIETVLKDVDNVVNKGEADWGFTGSNTGTVVAVEAEKIMDEARRRGLDKDGKHNGGVLELHV